MSLRSLYVALVSMVFVGTALSQQPPQQPLTRTAEPGLALEITFLKGVAPTYLRVPAPNVTNSWAWYSNFERVAGWQLPAGAQPINAVKIIPYLDVDIVRITVLVLRGVKFHDTEDMVATYAARENEKLTIAALKDFGVEPFEIRVVRVAPQPADVPTIVNKTTSLEVVGIEPVVSTFPVYKLTLRNLSGKNISALQVDTGVAGETKQNHMPQGKDGKPLIKAGDSAELKEPLLTVAQVTPEGYAPATPGAQQIVIATLVFEDGTYEGDAGPAATYRAFAAGRKTELMRMVPVLENALETSDSLEGLRTQLKAINCDVDPADVAALAKAFPGVDRRRLQSSIDVAMLGTLRELRQELESYEQTRHSAGDFRIWLTAMNERYSDWLARLNPSNTAQR